MANPTEAAVQGYIAAWQERDPDARARLIDECFAEEGRIVTGSATIRGRAELARAIDEFLADPRGLAARQIGPIDVRGGIARFRSHLVDRDGNFLREFFDAVEVGADGRIVLILAFGGAF